MNLKTYQAYTMAEALAAVKQDLGSDAVILNTRSFKRGGIWGVGAKTIVEVTAISSADARAQAGPTRNGSAPRSGVVRLKTSAARQAYAAETRRPVAEEAGQSPAPSPAEALVAQAERERTRRLALALEEQNRRKATAPAETPVTKTAATVPAPTPAQPAVEARTTAKPAAAIEVIANPPAPVARRFVLASADEPANSNANLAVRQAIAPSTGKTAISLGPQSTTPARPGKSIEPAPANAGSKSKPRVAPEITTAMQSELAAIKEMVGQVLQRQTNQGAAPSPAMPRQLFEMYLKLLAQDVSDELADQVVNRVRDELSTTELEDAALVREAVLRQLAGFIPAAPLSTTQTGGIAQRVAGKPWVIALVGPTGVGKTTTVAKLAATFKLRHGKKVGLITSDTYRIAAVDQLRTYANIIGLPLQVALSPADMTQAVHALQGCDVILIDTAGRSQNDANRIDELRTFITAANPNEVHLVLSSTAGEKVLLKEAEAFSAVGVHRIVLTKLDEAVSFGMLVNVIRQIGKQLSFVTTGQEVPDHLELGKAERLAELVLGGAVHA